MTKKSTIPCLLTLIIFFSATPSHAFYDYKTGRWLNQDPIGSQDGPNLYAYVNSNPINKTDPLGWCADPPCWGGSIPTDPLEGSCEAICAERDPMYRSSYFTCLEGCAEDDLSQQEGWYDICPPGCTFVDLGKRDPEYDPETGIRKMGRTYDPVWLFVAYPEQSDCKKGDAKIFLNPTTCKGEFWWSEGALLHEIIHVKTWSDNWTVLGWRAMEIVWKGCMTDDEALCYSKVINKLSIAYLYKGKADNYLFDINTRNYYDQKLIDDYKTSREMAEQLLKEAEEMKKDCSRVYYWN